MRRAMIVTAAAFALAACSKTEGGLTFKDGDFECSRGESKVEFKPGEVLKGGLGDFPMQLLYVDPLRMSDVQKKQLEAALRERPDVLRTMALRDRAKLCADFLSSANQDR